MDLNQFLIRPGSKIRLSDHDTAFKGKFSKSKALKELEKQALRLGELQDVMYAQNLYGALGVFQAIDGAGKDSVSRAVMTHVHSAGSRVTPFVAPSKHELDHTYLWRHMAAEPERGHFDIWIRSHLEEVLAVKIHPEILASQRLPDELKDKNIWRRRYQEIRNYHQYLRNNGIVVIVLFLHISFEEQWERLHDRTEDPKKHWKSSIGDIFERKKYWKAYHGAAERMLSEVGGYVVPADHKWFAKMLVAKIFVRELEKLELHYPKLNKKQREDLKETKRLLLAERRSK